MTQTTELRPGAVSIREDGENSDGRTLEGTALVYGEPQRRNQGVRRGRGVRARRLQGRAHEPPRGAVLQPPFGRHDRCRLVRGHRRGAALQGPPVRHPRRSRVPGGRARGHRRRLDRVHARGSPAFRDANHPQVREGAGCHRGLAHARVPVGARGRPAGGEHDRNDRAARGGHPGPARADARDRERGRDRAAPRVGRARGDDATRPTAIGRCSPADRWPNCGA